MHVQTAALSCGAVPLESRMFHCVCAHTCCDTRHLRGVWWLGDYKSWALILKAGAAFASRAADPEQGADYCPGNSPGFQGAGWVLQQSTQCTQFVQGCCLLGGGCTWAYRAAHGQGQSSLWKGKRQPKLEQQGSCQQGCGARVTRWGQHRGMGPDEGVGVCCDAKD